MVVGATQDFAYNAVLLAHFVFIIVGAGTAFVAPTFITRARRFGGRNIEDFAVESANRVVFPALLLAGVAGGALVGLSEDRWDFSQAWLSLAGILWVLSLVAALIAYPPRWFNVFNADDAKRRLARAALHVALVLLLIDMIWKDTLI